MIDVGHKPITTRLAQARAIVKLNDQILALVMENKLKKGDTSDLIPLCHNIQLSSVDVSFHVDTEHKEISIDSIVTGHAKTGVEMEALTAVTVAALTIYDMCKAVSNDITIRDVRLVRKKGGKSDYELIS
uniref:Molybdopterin cofactor biosynthesis C (MoaC) domain-containing protein n=1 Tax=Romanomermis culicivorax TaxID=13658 RepID=A0A915JMC3_ROMCU